MLSNPASAGLEADGLVSYADNPAHQRAKLAVLTRRGRATLDAITRRQIEWANGVASRLVESDLQHAIRTLQQVRAAIDSAAGSANRNVRRAQPAGARRRTAASKRRSS